MTNDDEKAAGPKAILRILHVEDDPRDRELVARRLLRDGIECEFAYADCVNSLEEALTRSGFDVILSDFTLPSYSGSAALSLAKAMRPEVPFIFVSGTIGEEHAVEGVKAGATDYVRKDRLERLSGSIRRALREAGHIAERKRTEEALRASEERFREVAETIEDVFWVTDSVKQRMIYISPAYEKIWGLSCQSLYDNPRSWLDAIHPEDRERVRRASVTRQAEGSYNEEYRIARPDGEVRWIRDRAFPLRNKDGRVERVVGVARDVTERRQLEEQFRQSQKLEAIGQLAGGVAHDFNNILGAIMMQTEITAMEADFPDEVREGLGQIAAYAERAASLTRQLLLFSRRQTPQTRDLDLNEAVTSLAKMLQRIIGEDVRLQLHLHSSPLVTRADPGMLDQVILNLAVNARDAMPAGGRLLIETTERTVDEAVARLHPDAGPGRYVCLSVSDTGGGIPPEVLPRIFDPFFTTKEPGKGTGLGLATVYGIVKQHRGWIEVESEPGCGSNFRILLPAEQATTAARDAARTKPRGGTETILLVEDEEAVRRVTRVILERYGYRVVEAANGLEALDLWRVHEGIVALVVTDLVMPAGLSGLELAGRLRKEKPRLKVVFTSGYSAEIAGRQLDAAFGENYLQKPYSSDRLLETIRRCLDG